MEERPAVTVGDLIREKGPGGLLWVVVGKAPKGRIFVEGPVYDERTRARGRQIQDFDPGQIELYDPLAVVII